MVWVAGAGAGKDCRKCVLWRCPGSGGNSEAPACWERALRKPAWCPLTLLRGLSAYGPSVCASLGAQPLSFPAAAPHYTEQTEAPSSHPVAKPGRRRGTKQHSAARTVRKGHAHGAHHTPAVTSGKSVKSTLAWKYTGTARLGQSQEETSVRDQRTLSSKSPSASNWSNPLPGPNNT